MDKYKIFRLLALVWLVAAGVALAVGGVQAYQAYTNKKTDDTSVGLESNCSYVGQTVSTSACGASSACVGRRVDYKCVRTTTRTCTQDSNGNPICTNTLNPFSIQGVCGATCTTTTPPPPPGPGPSPVPPPPPSSGGSTCNLTAPLGVTSIKTNPEPGTIENEITNLTMVMGKRNGSVCSGTPKYLINLKASPVPASGTCAALNSTYVLAGNFSYVNKAVVTLSSLNATQYKLDVKFPAVRKNSQGTVLFQFEAGKQYCVIAERSNGYKVTRSAPMKISFATN